MDLSGPLRISDISKIPQTVFWELLMWHLLQGWNTY